MHFVELFSVGSPILFFLLASSAPVVAGHIDHLEMPENMRKMAFLLHEHCVKETGVDEDWTLQMIKGTMPEDRNFGCYLHCMFDTIGLVSPDGHILFKEVMHLMPARHREVIEDVTDKCSTIHGENSCETAYLTVECFINQDSAQTLIRETHGIA